MITTSVLVRFINQWDFKNTPYLQQFCFRTIHYYFRVNKLSAILLKNILKIVGIILLPIYLILRDSWNDKFFGDPMDSRMSWVVYEHWYQFFHGNRELRNTLFFYPYDKSLGLSDTFLVNGIVHSFFRFVGNDPVDSWRLSNIFVLTVSIVGLAILSRKLFATYTQQFGFVILISTSYVFLNNMSGQPNISFYFVSSYFIISVLHFLRSDSTLMSKKLAFAGIILIPPLLLLSVWYAGFFTFLIVISFLLVLFVFNKDLYKMLFEKFYISLSSISKIYIYMCLLFSIFLYSIFLYIYLPNASVGNKVWEDVVRWQPDLEGNRTSIFNSINIIRYFYPNLTETDPMFVGIGFTSVLIILYLLILLILSTSFRSKFRSSVDLSVFISSLVIFALFLTVANFSIYEYLFKTIEPLRAIRFTSRVFVYLFAIWVYLFLKSFRYLDFNKKSLRNNKAIQILSILILVSLQLSPPISKWPKKVYEPIEYLGVTSQIQNNCKAFVVDSPGRGWWDDQLQGMTLMALTNIPTVNGYSGGFPAGYELGDWNEDSQLIGIGKWLIKNETTESICLVETSGIKYLNFPITIKTDENFDILESNSKGSSWNWSLSNNAKIKVLNFSQSLKQLKIQIQFEIRAADCELGPVNFQFTDRNGDLILDKQISSKMSKIAIDVELPDEEEAIYNLKVNTPGCLTDDGARRIFFLVKDLTFNSEVGNK